MLKHFVFEAVYRTQVGAYKEADVVVRPVPGMGRQRGLMTDYTPSKEGAHGWIKVSVRAGTKIAAETDHHKAEDRGLDRQITYDLSICAERAFPPRRVWGGFTAEGQPASVHAQRRRLL